MDRQLLLFIWLFEIALQKADHERVMIHHPWIYPSVEPGLLWVWRVVRPIIPGLNQALSLDACGYDKLPDSLWA
jgi:hypothetical protein